MSVERRVCRCGVYADLHPTSACPEPRHAYWWHRHSLIRHVRAWVWLHTPNRLRWRLCSRASGPARDWCQLVDVALAAERYREDRADYDCLCDVPLIRDVSGPRYGWCYCAPPEADR